LSSFSVDPNIASGFGLVVMESTINAEDIIALPLTGSGCLGESEAIVLGRSGLSGTIRGREAFVRRVTKMQAARSNAALWSELDEFAETLKDTGSDF